MKEKKIELLNKKEMVCGKNNLFMLVRHVIIHLTIITGSSAAMQDTASFFRLGLGFEVVARLGIQ